MNYGISVYSQKQNLFIIVMESSDNNSYSDGAKKQRMDAATADDSTHSSDEEMEIPEEVESTSYATWKMNAQYLYDLLLHHHTQWPCTTCSWGPVINESSVSSVAPLSQIAFLSTHTGRECQTIMNS